MKAQQLLAAGALVGVLAVGGASIASAQDTGSTSTTTDDSTSTQSTVPNQRDGNCPDRGEAPSDSSAADATSV